MIDEKELKNHFKWIANNGWCWEFPETIYDTLWDAIDDDRKGLEKVLSDMNAEELSEISGLFDDFYDKWPDRKMEKFLNSLTKKITDAGYRP